jgi:hypothetical protein
MARNYASQIAALLANAEDDSQSAAAREAYRNKAEELMRKYRIEEEEALATEGSGVVPIMDSLDIMERNAWGNPLRVYYWQMWSVITLHCGVRTSGKYDYAEDGGAKLTAVSVGYEGDVRYAELLWTAARLVFMTRIDAKVDVNLSDAENCYYMRNSGMKRNEIAKKLWGSASDDGAAHGKVQRLYLAECVRRDETPRVSGRGIQVDVYREAYARSFVSELSWRLQAASDAVDSTTGGLVLHGRKERVDEAFYKEFPNHRPMSAEEAAKLREEQEAEEAACERCKRAKSGKCSTHRPYEVTAAERRRFERKYASPEAYAGERSGRSAAKQVHIGRQTEKTTRATGSPERTALGS